MQHARRRSHPPPPTLPGPASMRRETHSMSAVWARGLARPAILPVEPVHPGLGNVGGDGHTQGPKEAISADRIDDAVAAKAVTHRGPFSSANASSKPSASS